MKDFIGFIIKINVVVCAFPVAFFIAVGKMANYLADELLKQGQ